MKGDQIEATLQGFIRDFGVPETSSFDGHTSQVKKGSLFMKTIRKYNIHYYVVAPLEQNPSERDIKQI